MVETKERYRQELGIFKTILEAGIRLAGCRLTPKPNPEFPTGKT
jgi:hypothetical protein